MLRAEQVAEVRALLGSRPEREIARLTGVGRTSVARIRKGLCSGKAEIPKTRCGSCGALVAKPCVKCRTLLKLAEKGIHPPIDAAELDKIDLHLRGSDGVRYAAIAADKMRLDPPPEMPNTGENPPAVESNAPQDTASRFFLFRGRRFSRGPNRGDFMSERIKRNYEAVRHLIYNGDLLLYRPANNPASEAIAAGGESEYSHAAVAVRWGNTLMVLEMAFTGGRAVTLSSQVRKNPGCWDVYQLNPQHLDEFDRGKMVEFMIRSTGTPYGWENFFTLCWRKLPFVRLFVRPISDDKLNGSTLICSQAVSRACRLAGCDPCPSCPIV